MKEIGKTILGIIKDQNGNGSSKRIVLLCALIILGFLTRMNWLGKVIDHDLLKWVVIIILVCIGAVISEFFKPNNNITPPTV